MTNIENFLNVLNNNPKTKALLDKFNETAKAENLTGVAYEKKRETVVMLAMMMNKDLVHQMADEIWEDVNR